MRWERVSESATALAWGSAEALAKEDSPGTRRHRPRRPPQPRLCQTCTYRSGRQPGCSPLSQSTMCNKPPENSPQCVRHRCPYLGPEGKYMRWERVLESASGALVREATEAWVTVCTLCHRLICFRPPNRSAPSRPACQTSHKCRT